MKKVLYLLGHLTDDDVEWMVANGTREHVPTGTVLIREGEPIQALHIVLDGEFQVSFPSSSGLDPVPLGSGEVLGEISFIDARPPSATVTARHDSVVLAIPRRALAARLDSDTAFAARFYRSLAVFLAHRVRETLGRLGYARGVPLNEDLDYEDELDTGVLHTLHQAGARFDRVLQRLLAE
jgi:bacteriocin-type transport-associated protein